MYYFSFVVTISALKLLLGVKWSFSYEADVGRMMNSWGTVRGEAFKTAASSLAGPSLQVGVVTERVIYKYVLQR